MKRGHGGHESKRIGRMMENKLWIKGEGIHLIKISHFAGNFVV